MQVVQWFTRMPCTQPTLLQIPAGGSLLHVKPPLSCFPVSYLSNKGVYAVKKTITVILTVKPHNNTVSKVTVAALNHILTQWFYPATP